jgi:hypothetical protein
VGVHGRGSRGAWSRLKSIRQTAGRWFFQSPIQPKPQESEDISGSRYSDRSGFPFAFTESDRLLLSGGHTIKYEIDRPKFREITPEPIRLPKRTESRLPGYREAGLQGCNATAVNGLTPRAADNGEPCFEFSVEVIKSKFSRRLAVRSSIRLDDRRGNLTEVVSS